MGKIYQKQQRFDTAANWKSANPVLLVAEFGIVSDSPSGEYKIGDGKTPWNGLPMYKHWDGSTGGGNVKDGESAYEIAVRNGFVGTEEEWLASLKGENGDPGSDAVVDQTLNEESNNAVANSAVSAKLRTLENKVPTKVSELTNDSHFATEQHVKDEIAKAQLGGGGEVDTSGFATKEELAQALTNYVQKVIGKDLSTNDFTNVLKEKLEGLENYDDAAMQQAIQTINTRIDTLVGTSASTAIDNFNEIEAFLQGITDSQSLTKMLSDLKSEITALIPEPVNEVEVNDTHLFPADEDTEVYVDLEGEEDPSDIICPEAPKDGKKYVRKNGTWVEETKIENPTGQDSELRRVVNGLNRKLTIDNYYTDCFIAIDNPVGSSANARTIGLKGCCTKSFSVSQGEVLMFSGSMDAEGSSIFIYSGSDNRVRIKTTEKVIRDRIFIAPEDGRVVFNSIMTEDFYMSVFKERKRTVMLIGASFAEDKSMKKWFGRACHLFPNLEGINKAKGGRAISDDANNLYNGTLFTPEEFERTDIFLIMHVHNEDVASKVGIKENYEDYITEYLQQHPGGKTPFDRENYAKAYDYLIKKLKADCYNLKNQEGSKYYNKANGKPCNIVLMTHWHDARTAYNDSVRVLAKSFGIPVVELDKNIGFSKDHVHPVTGMQESRMYSGDTEVIGDVTYGWHPGDGEIQDRIARITAEKLDEIFFLMDGRHLIIN